MRFEPAVLAMLDIGGYTPFIRQRATTLPHAEAIVTELLEAIIDGAEHPLQLNKLEGDAALLWSEPGADLAATAVEILAHVDAAFRAFDQRRDALAVERAHCQCGACVNITGLGLKALLHSGEIAHKNIRGLHELAGEPVILIHRLLKNTIVAPRYVLLTESMRSLLGERAGPLEEVQVFPDGFEPQRVFFRTPPQARHWAPAAPTAQPA